MISRNKGILSLEFLVPNVGLLIAALAVESVFATLVRPHAQELAITQKLLATQNKNFKPERSIYVIIKDPEQESEIILWIWAGIIMTYKLVQVGRERALLQQDFVKVQQGERIIPEDALDRYKELKSAVEREPKWRERLLPECLLAALHRLHATSSIQDASAAIKERAELAADTLDSSLSLIRYIAWAIPAIGFIGTVRGIGDALAQAEDAIKGDLSGVTDSLGLAFNSTLVALLLSMVLMFVMHMLQSRQEAFIIEIQTYCRDKLINVMKVPAKEEVGEVLS